MANAKTDNYEVEFIDIEVITLQEEDDTQFRTYNREYWIDNHGEVHFTNYLKQE